MCGALCEALVIVRDLKHYLLGYFILHIIGNTARFVGAFVPVLINTRRREFIDGNHRLTHSVSASTRRATSGPGLVTTHYGLGRVMTNCPARGCISQLKIHPVGILSVPDPPRG